MIKQEVIKEISSKTGIVRIDVEDSVEALLKVIKRAMVDGDQVHFNGFGTFYFKVQREKIGQDIRKGVSVVIPERVIPAFKPAKLFVEQVREGSKKFFK